MATHIIRNAFMALLLTSMPVLAIEQTDPAKEADIRRLIDLTGSLKTAHSVMTTSIQQMRPLLEKSLPDSPHKTEIIDTFVDRFPRQARMEDLVNRIVPIYDRNLTHAEILGLIDFYQTPLGQRVIQVLPQILQESQAAGAELGQEVGKKVMMEIIQEIQAREKNE